MQVKDGESLMTDVCQNAILKTMCLKCLFPFPFPKESDLINLILSTTIPRKPLKTNQSRNEEVKDDIYFPPCNYGTLQVTDHVHKTNF